MTEPASQNLDSGRDWTSTTAKNRLSRRYRSERRLRYAGLTAIGIALLLLLTLFASLIQAGYLAFYTTKFTLSVNLDPSVIDRNDPGKANYRNLARSAFLEYFPDVTNRRDQRDLFKIMSNGAPFIVRDHVLTNPELIGRRVEILIPFSDPFDQLYKGVIPRYISEADGAKTFNPRLGSEKVLGWFDQILARGIVFTPFSWELFFNSDSRFPELAGLGGAIAGSFFALLVCLLLSLPIAIAAAVYLEEFAPKNRLTDLIEVNINNLAAVPSVVFGLLGLALFLNTFGLPRSAPLVGGMVLALMTLPTIIVATRAALKAVPPSIREAALGIGASRHQVILHHVLPLALPGIMTGTIIGLAQALGETAPLLLIGMNAFIPSIENIGFLQPATALPTQIFSWADSPERGFVARTSAAILVLLGFLILMNAIAIFLRQRFERKW